MNTINYSVLTRRACFDLDLPGGRVIPAMVDASVHPMPWGPDDYTPDSFVRPTLTNAIMPSYVARLTLYEIGPLAIAGQLGCTPKARPLELPDAEGDVVLTGAMRPATGGQWQTNGVPMFIPHRPADHDVVADAVAAKVWELVRCGAARGSFYERSRRACLPPPYMMRAIEALGLHYRGPYTIELETIRLRLRSSNWPTWWEADRRAYYSDGMIGWSTIFPAVTPADLDAGEIDGVPLPGTAGDRRLAAAAIRGFGATP